MSRDGRNTFDEYRIQLNNCDDVFLKLNLSSFPDSFLTIFISDSVGVRNDIILDVFKCILKRQSLPEIFNPGHILNGDQNFCVVQIRSYIQGMNLNLLL